MLIDTLHIVICLAFAFIWIIVTMVVRDRVRENRRVSAEASEQTGLGSPHVPGVAAGKPIPATARTHERHLSPPGTSRTFKVPAGQGSRL